MATLVIMPRQGQSVESCVITEWVKKVGDKVNVGDVLFSYETDKSSFEETAQAVGNDCQQRNQDVAENHEGRCLLAAEREVKRYAAHNGSDGGQNLGDVDAFHNVISFYVSQVV